MYKIYRGGVIRLEDQKIITNDNHTDWAEYNKWLSIGNYPQPADPEPKPERTLEDVREEKIRNLKEHVDMVRIKLNGDRNALEMAWMLLRYQEAKAFNPQNPQATPLIHSIAQSAGIPHQQVVNRTIRQIEDNIQLEGQIEGTYIKHLRAIKALNSRRDIRSYDIKADWPQVNRRKPGEQ